MTPGVPGHRTQQRPQHISALSDKAKDCSKVAVLSLPMRLTYTYTLFFFFSAKGCILKPCFFKAVYFTRLWTLTQLYKYSKLLKSSEHRVSHSL